MLPSSLIINENNKSNLLVLSKWLKFFSILSFIFSGLMIFLAIAMILMGGSLPVFANLSLGGSFGFLGLGLFYVLLALISLYPAIKLYRSSKDLKLALHSSDQISLDSGFKNLMQHFRFNGIMSIIFLGLYLFAILFALGFAVYSKSSGDKFGVEISEEHSSSDIATEDSVSYAETEMDSTSK